MSNWSPRNFARLLALLCAAIVALPACAQIDLSGVWMARYHEDEPERVPGPELADYLGLPITPGARMRAETYDAALLELPEYQCRPHPSDYGDRHSHLRIWNEIDPATQKLVAIRTHREWQAQERHIWMDGRPQPPDYAPHTWQGFSTGHWDGNMLTIHTTQLKTSYIRRNGMARSDLADVTEHFIRNGRYLTIVTIVHDPVYLTEPFIRSSDYALDNTRALQPYPCETVVEVERPLGVVPHHLPGSNPYLTEFATRYGLPYETTRGGAETMYPEYQIKLRQMEKATPAGK